MRKCCVLNKRFLFILFKQVVMNNSISELICFSSGISFSFTMSFRTLPWISRFGQSLFDFSPFLYHWHLLRTRIPSGISSKISSNSCLCLLRNFIFSSLWIFVSRTFILFSKLLIFLLFSLLKWFRESYAELADLIFEKIEKLFCLLSFKLFKIYIYI